MLNYIINNFLDLNIICNISGNLRYLINKHLHDVNFF